MNGNSVSSVIDAAVCILQLNAKKLALMKKNVFRDCIINRGGTIMNKHKMIENAVKMHSQTILKVAYAYTKNIYDAEDIVQEVYVSLYKNIWKLSSEEHIKAWLIRVTINKSKNFIKSNWVIKRTEMPDDLIYLPKEQKEVLEAVLSLDEKYRIPIHLMYYEGYSINEIAEIMKIKPSTIGTRLKRGRELLKDMLGGDFDA